MLHNDFYLLEPPEFKISKTPKLFLLSVNTSCIYTRHGSQSNRADFTNPLFNIFLQRQSDFVERLVHKSSLRLKSHICFSLVYKVVIMAFWFSVYGHSQSLQVPHQHFHAQYYILSISGRGIKYIKEEPHEFIAHILQQSYKAATVCSSSAVISRIRPHHISE